MPNLGAAYRVNPLLLVSRLASELEGHIELSTLKFECSTYIAR